MKPTRSIRSGSVLLLTMVFLVLFTTLAIAFNETVNTGLRQSHNYRSAQAAQLAAEGGLQFAIGKLDGILVEGQESPNMVEIVADTLASEMHGTANLEGGYVTLCGDTATVPPIALAGGGSFSFRVDRIDDSMLHLTVTGQAEGLQRRIRIACTTHEDMSVLRYAVASRSRILLTDGAVVSGDLCSTWNRTRISGVDVPPFLLEPDTAVQGSLKTTLSEEDYNEYDSGDYVEGATEGTEYDEPEFMEYTTADFDTSSFKAGLTPLPAPDRTISADPFPDGSNIRRRIDRPVYENRTFENIVIPKGTNPKFINCTFRSITYVDTNETIPLGTSSGQWSHDYYQEHAIPGRESRSQDRHNNESNNVIFDGCTFEGPVITAVPRDYWWSKNALTFTGETTFRNSHMSETTIMAPNFGVDIGGRGYDADTNPDSKITGIIVGGIVDVRGVANIEGTILSMYYPDTDRGSAARYYGTNLGFIDDGGETAGASGVEGDIRIVPNPHNGLPFGMKRKYSLCVESDSYEELF